MPVLSMDPARKRQIRLVIALGSAVLLAVALVYVSFSGSSQAREPSELDGISGGSYELTGKVVKGSVEREHPVLSFDLSDREDPSATIQVRYEGQVPDPFREGREVIVTGTVENGIFVAERDSLITKCPSKFQEEAEKDPEHVIIVDD
jgi:cytochrome c-type biogenesis protein CcmE